MSVTNANMFLESSTLVEYIISIMYKKEETKTKSNNLFCYNILMKNFHIFFG